MLEEFEDHFEQLRNVFGWKNFDIPSGTANSHTHKPWTEEQTKVITEATSVDMQLYEAAQRIAAKRTAKAKAARHASEVATPSAVIRTPLFSSDASFASIAKLFVDSAPSSICRDAVLDGTTFSAVVPANEPRSLVPALPPGALPLYANTRSKLRVLMVGFSDTGSKQLFDQMCAKGYVGARGATFCNIEAVGTVHQQNAAKDAHIEAYRLHATMAWGPAHRILPAKDKDPRFKNLVPAGTGCLLTSANVPTQDHCKVGTWLEQMRAALRRVAASGIEILADNPYNTFAPELLALAPGMKVIHTLRPSASWANVPRDAGKSADVLCKEEFWWKTGGTDSEGSAVVPLNDVASCATAAARVLNMPAEEIEIRHIMTPLHLHINDSHDATVKEAFRRYNTMKYKMVMASPASQHYVATCGEDQSHAAQFSKLLSSGTSTGMLWAKDASLVQLAKRHLHPELAVPWFKLKGGVEYFNVGLRNDVGQNKLNEAGHPGLRSFNAVHVVTSR